MHLFLLAFAGLFSAGVNVAAKSPPAAPPPFDLRLLPGGPDGGVLAFRPSELFKQSGLDDAGMARLVAELTKVTSGSVSLAVNADDLPKVADVGQVVISLGVNLTVQDGEENSEFGLSSVGGRGYVRTVKPFDWAALVKKLAPTATEEKVGDRVVWKVPLPFGPLTFHAWVFCPDDRTAVFDLTSDRDRIDAVIDGLAAMKPVEPPAGWAEVCHHQVAYAFPFGDLAWVSRKGGAASLPDLEKRLARVESVAAGVTFGDRTEALAVATAESKAAAGKVRRDVDQLIDSLRERATQAGGGEPPELATRRDGKTVRANWVVESNPLKDAVKQVTQAADAKR